MHTAHMLHIFITDCTSRARTHTTLLGIQHATIQYKEASSSLLARVMCAKSFFFHRLFYRSFFSSSAALVFINVLRTITAPLWRTAKEICILSYYKYGRNNIRCFAVRCVAHLNRYTCRKAARLRAYFSGEFDRKYFFYSILINTIEKC